MCHYLLRIPCNPAFSSLNLATAVQVVCYELFVASGQKSESSIGDKNETPLASTQQMELFYEHMQQTLLDIDFYIPKNPFLSCEDYVEFTIEYHSTRKNWIY